MVLPSAEIIDPVNNFGTFLNFKKVDFKAEKIIF
jgi:hypothetical protein